MPKIKTEIADCYQVLFNHMVDNYNLTLSIDQMDEIINKTLEVVIQIEAIENPF